MMVTLTWARRHEHDNDRVLREFARKILRAHYLKREVTR